jgi:hypothetical protein
MECVKAVFLEDGDLTIKSIWVQELDMEAKNAAAFRLQSLTLHFRRCVVLVWKSARCVGCFRWILSICMLYLFNIVKSPSFIIAHVPQHVILQNVTEVTRNLRVVWNVCLDDENETFGSSNPLSMDRF